MSYQLSLSTFRDLLHIFILLIYLNDGPLGDALLDTDV